MGSGLPSIIQNKPGSLGATTAGDRSRRDIVAAEGSGRRRRWMGQCSLRQAQEVGRSQMTDQ